MKYLLFLTKIIRDFTQTDATPAWNVSSRPCPLTQPQDTIPNKHEEFSEEEAMGKDWLSPSLPEQITTSALTKETDPMVPRSETPELMPQIWPLEAPEDLIMLSTVEDVVTDQDSIQVTIEIDDAKTTVSQEP